LHGIGDVVVTIATVNLDGDEEFTPLNAPGVIAEGRKLGRDRRPYSLSAGRCKQIFQIDHFTNKDS
jgi:hypothetical protein